MKVNFNSIGNVIQEYISYIAKKGKTKYKKNRSSVVFFIFGLDGLSTGVLSEYFSGKRRKLPGLECVESRKGEIMEAVNNLPDETRNELVGILKYIISLDNSFDRRQEFLNSSEEGGKFVFRLIKVACERSNTTDDNTAQTKHVQEIIQQKEQYHPVIIDNETLASWIRVQRADKTPTDQNIIDFLKGSNCTWSVAGSKYVFTRNIVNALVKQVESGGITVLLGAGGEGKSTALKQMCVRLYDNGKTVLYHRGDDYHTGVANDIVYVIDAPENDGNFKEFYRWAVGCEATVVIGSRMNEWNFIKDKFKIDERDYKAMEISEIDGEEAEQLAHCIEKYLGGTLSRDHDGIVDVLTNNSYGFLYAAMLMITQNASNLEAIAKHILEKLNAKSDKPLKLLAHIVLSEKLCIPFSDELFTRVCQQLELSKTKAKEFLEKEAIQNGKRWTTRHETIAALFFAYIFEEELYDLPSDFMCNAAKVLLDRQLELHNKLTEEYCNKTYIPQFQSDVACISKYIGSILSYIDSADKDTKEHFLNSTLDYFKGRTHNLLQIYNAIENATICSLLMRLCLARGIYDSQLLQKIIGDAKKSNGIGQFHSPEKYTVRWIYRITCNNTNNEPVDESIWLHWAQLEEGENRTGSYDEENTARWIFREACLNRNVGQVGENLWLHWAQLEQDENGIGSYDEENTACWIFREACLNRKVGQAGKIIWYHWARLEQELGKIGSYDEENTARWIYRKACIEHKIAHEDIWFHWAQLEQKENGIGSYDEEYTARWIFREACINRKVGQAGKIIWYHWARLEQELGKIGSYDEENTARWIFRKACIEHKIAHEDLWFHWAQLEQRENRIGSYDEENTARWIFHEACVKRGAGQKRSDIWHAWAKVE